MNRAPVITLVITLASALAGGAPAGASATPAHGQAPAAQGQDQGTLDLLFDQGKRQFDAFQYDQAVPLFDRLIQAMTTGPEVQRPELLVQVYELRARARFALGDSTGAEQDFSALLALRPDFTLAAGVSPRVIAVLDNVRRLTIGQLIVEVAPAGDITIDGRRYTVTDAPLTVDLTGGDHVVNATRPNFTPFERTVTVTPGSTVAITITLERVSSTVTVITTPDDVEVFLNGASKGRTSGAASSLVIDEVPLGTHRLRLARDCYVDIDMPLTVGAEDGQTVPVELTQAVARVTIQGAGTGATVVIDGQARGPLSGDIAVCAGERILEVRSPRGRFVDRRVWTAGDAVTIPATLRAALPLISVAPPAGTSPEQVRQAVERALARSGSVLVFDPEASELGAALRQENVPAGWLTPAPAGDAPAQGSAAVRDIGRRLSARLDAQGVAAVVAGPDPNTVTLLLLAAGSGVPDALTLHLTDPVSLDQVATQLGAPLPSLVRPSLDASLVDVTQVGGAAVVRAADGSGLSVGDVVTSANDRPVTSVADLRTALDALPAPAATVSVDVRGADGATRQVDVPIVRTIDLLPLSDPGRPGNLALLSLQDAAQTAAGLDGQAASIGLAVLHLRLGNWDDALAAAGRVQLPDGPGVSAGTAAYLRGLALEGLGRAAEARTAFTAAAAQPQARLWFEGPLVAPLARARLQDRR